MRFDLTDSPCSAFADAPLVLGLFVVQLVVAGVSAAGGSCDHRSGLRMGDSRCCVVSGTCRGKIRLTGRVKRMYESVHRW